MHNRLVRNWVIFFIVMAYVISAKHGLVNAVFAIWMGAWSMSKLFNPLFGRHQGFENLTAYDFLPPYRHIFIRDRKLSLFLLLWWSGGVLAAFLTYQLLKILLIPS